MTKVETPYKMYLVLGDWSDDGHGQSNKVLVHANHPVEDIQKAYKASCKLIGISFHHIHGNENYTGVKRQYPASKQYEVATEYESGLTLTETVKEALTEHGVPYKESYDDSDDIKRDYTILWLEYVKKSLPTLVYSLEKQKDDTPVINGYWNKNLNVQFGYGLYY